MACCSQCPQQAAALTTGSQRSPLSNLATGDTQSAPQCLAWGPGTSRVSPELPLREKIATPSQMVRPLSTLHKEAFRPQRPVLALPLLTKFASSSTSASLALPSPPLPSPQLPSPPLPCPPSLGSSGEREIARSPSPGRSLSSPRDILVPQEGGRFAYYYYYYLCRV